jgi:peptide/nickel transport system permease protein
VSRYLAQRLVQFFPTAVAALLLVFGLAKLVPGDPVSMLVGQMAAAGGGQGSAQVTAALRKVYGLDRPFLLQFGDYLLHIARLDFGQSISGNLPVGTMLARSLPISAQLGGVALLLLVGIGIPLGMVAALNSHSWLDSLIVGIAIVLRAVPVFVLGPILMSVFVLWLHVADVPYGWNGLFDPKMIIPVFLLAAPAMALVIQQTRIGVLDVLANDYVRTARGKGIPPLTIVVRHVLPNALVPVITSLGLVVAYTITSTVFIDRMYSIPGFGLLYWNSIQNLDYPVLLATTVVVTLTVLLSNLLVDVLYQVLDPRVRIDKPRS